MRTGDVWHLTFEQLSEATLLRGHSWWRLNLVHAPEAIVNADVDPNQVSGDKFISHGWKVILALLIALSFLLKTVPHEAVYKELPVTMVPERELPKIYEIPAQRSRAKRIELPKKEEVAPTPAVVPKVAKENEIKQKAQTAAKSKVDTSKIIKKMAGGTGEKVDRARLAAQSRAKALQDALGGVSALVKKDIPEGEAGGAKTHRALSRERNAVIPDRSQAGICRNEFANR